MRNKLERTIAALSIASLGLLATGLSAQERTLYIGMNGGTMEKTYVEKVFPDFERPTTPRWSSFRAVRRTSSPRRRRARTIRRCM